MAVMAATQGVTASEVGTKVPCVIFMACIYCKLGTHAYTYMHTHTCIHIHAHSLAGAHQACKPSAAFVFCALHTLNYSKYKAKVIGTVMASRWQHWSGRVERTKREGLPDAAAPTPPSLCTQLP